MNDTAPRVRGIARRNRPVHVARRDACVERATELLIMPLEHMDTGARIDHVGRVIRLLEKALGEAELAARGDAVSPIEQDFTHFLNLILSNVRSADAFLDHQAHLESDEHSFLTKFLGIGPDEIALAAMNYQRLSVEVLAALWQMLRLMHVPYHTLQQKNQGEFDEADRARYQTAYQHLRGELQARPAPAGA